MTLLWLGCGAELDNAERAPQPVPVVALEGAAPVSGAGGARSSGVRAGGDGAPAPLLREIAGEGDARSPEVTLDDSAGEELDRRLERHARMSRLHAGRRRRLPEPAFFASHYPRAGAAAGSGRISWGEPLVAGGMTQQQAAGSIRSAVNVLRFCQHAAAGQAASVQGTVTVKLQVSAPGAIRRVEWVASTLKKGAVRRRLRGCWKRILMRIQFPRTQARSIVRLPLRVSRAKPSSAHPLGARP